MGRRKELVEVRQAEEGRKKSRFEEGRSE